jgi:hypothetical protein
MVGRIAGFMLGACVLFYSGGNLLVCKLLHVKADEENSKRNMDICFLKKGRVHLISSTPCFERGMLGMSLRILKARTKSGGDE